MIKYQKLSIPSKSYNEDGYIIQPPMYVVFDGATPLFNQDSNESSASHMVRFLESNLYSKYNEFHSFEKALHELSKAYHHAQDTIDYDKAKTPSAGIAAVIEDKDYFNLYVLGDCEIVYLNQNDHAKRFAYYDLQNLDRKAIKQMKEIAKKQNIDFKTARSYIDDTIISNRRLMNEKDGYNVFAPSKCPTFQIKTKRILKSTTKPIFIYTDGFGQAFDNLKIAKGYTNLFKSSLDIEY
ncbi:MAG: hypothetical protein RG740_05340, partial [Acholeplasmataceae bacterium]|nr:hypothetical protein [Acholeplasmataceae bacterium]